MSESHSDEHTSLIKTPQQLIIVVALAFIVPIVIIVLLSQLVTTGIHTSDNAAASNEAVAERLKPVGQVSVIDPNAPKVEKSGKEVVDEVCGACHGAGLLGAPKIGDKGMWRAHIAGGLEHLTHNAIQGIKQMPPRGGNPDLSDLEVARAIVYMANQSGANFKEPSAPLPAAGKAAAPAKTAAAAKAPAK